MWPFKDDSIERPTPSQRFRAWRQTNQLNALKRKGLYTRGRSNDKLIDADEAMAATDREADNKAS